MFSVESLKSLKISCSKTHFLGQLVLIHCTTPCLEAYPGPGGLVEYQANWKSSLGMSAHFSPLLSYCRQKNATWLVCKACLGMLLDSMAACTCDTGVGAKLKRWVLIVMVKKPTLSI